MDTNKKRKLVRSSQKQLSALVDYMTNHQKFANGEYIGSMGHQLHMKEWERLRAYLSELGPDKTVEQWRTTWRDMKKRARVEGGRVRLAQVKTGNNTDVPDLNDCTRKILSVIGTECSLGLDLDETPIAVEEVTVGPSVFTTQTYTATSATLLTRSTPPATFTITSSLPAITRSFPPSIPCTTTHPPTSQTTQIPHTPILPPIQSEDTPHSSATYTPQSYIRPTTDIVRPTFIVTSSLPAITRSFPPSIPCTTTHPPASQTTQIPHTLIHPPIQSEDTPHSSATVRHSNTHNTTFIRPNINSSRPRRARQGQTIRDVVHSDGQTRQVLSEICTELKLRNVQNIIKNRRHHQKR